MLVGLSSVCIGAGVLCSVCGEFLYINIHLNHPACWNNGSIYNCFLRIGSQPNIFGTMFSSKSIGSHVQIKSLLEQITTAIPNSLVLINITCNSRVLTSIIYTSGTPVAEISFYNAPWCRKWLLVSGVTHSNILHDNLSCLLN